MKLLAKIRSPSSLALLASLNSSCANASFSALVPLSAIFAYCNRFSCRLLCAMPALAASNSAAVINFFIVLFSCFCFIIKLLLSARACAYLLQHIGTTPLRFAFIHHIQNLIKTGNGVAGFADEACQGYRE